MCGISIKQIPPYRMNTARVDMHPVIKQTVPTVCINSCFEYPLVHLFLYWLTENILEKRKKKGMIHPLFNEIFKICMNI